MGKSKRKASKAQDKLAPVQTVLQKVVKPPSAKAPDAQKKAARRKEKPLILCARGITFRYRHLMTDLMQLIPHNKSDSKLDTKHDWNVINEIAELKGATSVMFFEARKRQDLYLWLAKVPSGPTIRFYCTNVHTMAELKLSGNHLKGSRSVLSFDKNFDLQPHLQLMKELLTQIFAVPKGHQKSKPFFDHVVSFAWADNRVWLRNYQLVTALDKKQVKAESMSLVEVGPRVTLQPIKVFAGSFRGKVLFENPEFISPNAVRSYEKNKAAGKYSTKVKAAKKAKARTEKNKVALDELANSFAPVRDSDDDGADMSNDDDDDDVLEF